MTFCMFLFLQNIAALESELSKQQEANLDLSAELQDGNTTDDLKKAVADLEAQLEHARKSEQLALASKEALEEELKNLRTLEEVSYKYLL